MQTICLPPNTNKLSSFQFGTLHITLLSQLQLPNCKYYISFSHSSLFPNISKSSSLNIPIYSSLWHFHKYLHQYPKLLIEVHSNGIKKGTGNIHLPSIVHNKLTRKSRNIMGNVEKKVSIFQVDGNQEYGSIELGFRCQFNDEYSNQICNLIEQDLVEGELDNLPISDINLKSQKEIILPQDHSSTRPHNTIQHLPSTRQNHHFTINKQHQIQKLRNLQKSIENELSSQINKIKSPLPKTYSKQRQTYYNIKQNRNNQQELQNQMEEDIDKLIEEMQSKVYNSTKYQDSQDTNYVNRLGNTGTSRPTGLVVTEYGVDKGRTAGEFKQIPSYSINHTHNSYQINNLSSSNYTRDNSMSMTNNLKKQPKTLKIHIHELGFSGGIFNRQQFDILSNSQLQITFPNKHSIVIPSQPKGQAIVYQSDHQIPIQQIYLNTGSSILFQNCQKQIVTFAITSRFNGKQLGYGVFQLDRLIASEGSGIFIVAINNRNRLQKSSSRVRISASELSTLKPVNISMYNMRIKLQLVSSIKNKLYQLLLFIKNIQFKQSQQQQNQKYQIQYKTIGSFDNISVKGEEGIDLNHQMMIPVLLQSIIKQNPKLVIQVWKENKSRLIGTVELQTSSLQRLLNIETGVFNDQALNVNVEPFVLELGDKDIRSIGTKERKGAMDVGLYFGSVKQINYQLGKLTKGDRKVESVGKGTKKEIVIPYDETLGVFVKEKKKEMKQIEVQVELDEYIQEMSKSKMSFDELQFKYQNQKEEMMLGNQSYQIDKIQDKAEDAEEEDQFEPFVINQSRRKQESIQQTIYQSKKQQQFQIPTPTSKSQQEPIKLKTEDNSFKQTIPLQSQLPSLPQPSPSIPPKTLSQQYTSLIQSTLHKVLSLSLSFLSTLKSLLKPHLQFNFIQKHKLFQCIQQSAPITYQTIDQLFQLLPSNQSDLINVTPLYDYFTCLQITKHIDLKLISEELLADYIISRLIESYMEDGCEQCYIQDYDDIKEVFMRKDIYLTLRERDIFWKRYQRDLNIKDVVEWNRVFIVVSQNIKKRYQSVINKETEQQQILEALYGNKHSQEQQQLIINKNKNYLIVTLKGIDTCIESTECLLGIKARSSSVVLEIKGKSIVFVEDGTGVIEGLEIFKDEFEAVTGRMRLIINDEKISESNVGLGALTIGELEGTYSFKDQEGSFCGLVRLGIQYVDS